MIIIIKKHSVHEALSKRVLREDLVVKSKHMTRKEYHQYNTNPAGIFLWGNVVLFIAQTQTPEELIYCIKKKKKLP